MHSIIVFASGTGTNTQAIIDFFKGGDKARVSLIVCNKPGAGVLDIAGKEQIPSLLIDKTQFSNPELAATLASYKPSLIVLAGFLWKIPGYLVDAFPGRIINIHPALLPAYGGKGMYGQHVHSAVLQAGDKESGITIHYVNEVYDSGNILLQARCPVYAGDDAAGLASRIHRLEHYYLPRTIEFLLDDTQR
jgi:phosphoribosylglycinamide formyltransferase-1